MNSISPPPPRAIPFIPTVVHLAVEFPDNNSLFYVFLQYWLFILESVGKKLALLSHWKFSLMKKTNFLKILINFEKYCNSKVSNVHYV